LVAVDEPDHSDVAAEQFVYIGQRVFTGGRVEQVRTGDVAKAVAECDESAE
jgi:hypothetical protein